MEIVYHISEKDLDILVKRVVSRLQESSTTSQPVWLTPKQALIRLGLKSKTSLYQLRMRGEITYTQLGKRVIMYSASSIDNYLLRNVKESF